MKRPKLLIVVLFQNLREAEPYYAPTPAPPLPGLLLAGMTPPIVEIEVLHEMVRPIDYATDADFVAISFMDYLAPHAYEVAARFRRLGKIVVGGGKYVSTFPDEAQPHFDSMLVGEAQGVWPQMVEDLVAGRLKPRYVAAEAASLAGIPAPRYDLAEAAFSVPVVTETSRGCPYACTYCQLNIRRQPYRVRPVADVIHDLESQRGLPFHRRKLAMILDNNLGGDLAHAKALLREIAKLDFWGIGVQLSIDCLEDEELVDLLARAHCCMAFVGLESLSEASLKSVGKRHNRVEEYERLFARLHRRGIVTFVGLMFALDEDTAEDYAVLAEKLERTGVCVILSSIAVPIYGTPLHRKMSGRGQDPRHGSLPLRGRPPGLPPPPPFGRGDPRGLRALQPHVLLLAGHRPPARAVPPCAVAAGEPRPVPAAARRGLLRPRAPLDLRATPRPAPCARLGEGRCA